uniref:HIT-type domain-containing protein n=3 Tax=Oryza TaxID=4527 RepID=A0A0E0FVA6_ORYNI
MAGGSCDVCKEAPSKYKCPACRTPYWALQTVSLSLAVARWHALKITKINFARRQYLWKKLASHLFRRKFQGTLGHWKKQQIVLMTRIKPLSDTTCPTQYPNTLHSAKSLEVEDPSWLVDKNGLRSLAESNEIRDALKDCKLQQMLLKIDGSAEPEKILDIVSPQQ